MIHVQEVPQIFCSQGPLHLALFSLRTESDNPDATCELSP